MPNGLSRRALASVYSRRVPPPDSLPAAVDRLYAVFAAVPRPVAIDGCEHCWTEQEAAVLLGPVPLRELSAGDLRPYAAGVLLTIGDIADFRYFLPRILEIACTDGFNWPDLEPLAGRLLLAEWETWTAEERAAVREVLWACWKRVLTGHPESWGADAVLCAIGNAEDDLAPYLEAWAAALEHPAAAAELRDLLRFSVRSKDGAVRLTNAFWDDRDAQAAAWVSGSELRAALVAAAASAGTEEALQVLVDIDELLAMYAR